MAGSELSGGVLELFGYANAPVDTLRTLAHLADDGLRAHGRLGKGAVQADADSVAEEPAPPHSTFGPVRCGES